MIESICISELKAFLAGSAGTFLLGKIGEIVKADSVALTRFLLAPGEGYRDDMLDANLRGPVKALLRVFSIVIP